MESFDKYQKLGAYHWDQVLTLDPRRYNAPLAARYAAILRSGIIFRGKFILDVGCGDGFLTHLLAKAKSTAIGIDPSSLAIQLAKQRTSTCSYTINPLFLEASAYELPFRGESFDIVILADVIEHLEDPHAALEEVTRVLRRDGTLLISTPQRRGDERLWDIHHVQEYTGEEMRAFLKNYFDQVIVRLSQPLFLHEWYKRTFMGKRLPLIALNCIARLFFNPFNIEDKVLPTRMGQLTVIARKNRARRGDT